MFASTDPSEILTGFNGLFDRGIDDVCPLDHLTECYDCVFPGQNQVKTRDGFNAVSIGRTCNQFFQDLTPTSVHDVLVLTGDGKLWSSREGQIHNFGATVDGFTAINLYNRIYLCPTKTGGSYAGALLYFWDGVSATIQKAAGVALDANLISDYDQDDVGFVSAGTHRIAFSLVYKTGFISPPSATFSITAPGSKSINLVLNDPGANALIESVYVLMTKADEEELFLVKTIAFRAATETINAEDTELLVSADYLIDSYEEIPGGASLYFYKGRLIIGGHADNGHQCLVSAVQDPEVISTVDGMLTTPRDASGNTIRAVFGLRDTLYIAKFTGVSAFQDNGDVPSTWPISSVDGGYGCYDKGLSCFVSGLPAVDVLDQAFIAHKTGLFSFDGVFRAPVMSWKIEELWSRINFNYFYKVSLAHDIWNKVVYVTVPLDEETTPTTILMMDYKEGLSPANIKWSYWRPSTEPTYLSMASLASDAYYKLRYGSRNANNICGSTPGLKYDVGNVYINSSITLPPISAKSGWVCMYNGLRLRVTGAGDIDLTVYGEDKVKSVTPISITLAASPGMEYYKQFNLTNEKAQLNIVVDGTLSSWFSLSRIEIFGRPMWMIRPVTPA